MSASFSAVSRSLVLSRAREKMNRGRERERKSAREIEREEDVKKRKQTNPLSMDRTVLIPFSELDISRKPFDMFVQCKRHKTDASL